MTAADSVIQAKNLRIILDSSLFLTASYLLHLIYKIYQQVPSISSQNIYIFNLTTLILLSLWFTCTAVAYVDCLQSFLKTLIRSLLNKWITILSKTHTSVTFEFKSRLLSYMAQHLLFFLSLFWVGFLSFVASNYSDLFSVLQTLSQPTAFTWAIINTSGTISSSLI